MNNPTKRFAILLCAIVFAACAVIGQENKQELTPAEKKAVGELGQRFTQRLNDSGDVEPLIKELFVSDFMKRYVKEELEQIKEGNSSADGILFTSGIEYDADLLKKATEDDWRALYVSTFNFMQYGFVVMLNAQAKSISTGRAVGDAELEKLLSEMYPDSAMKLINSNLILRNFVSMGNDSRPIRNVEELRAANKVLAQVNGMLLDTPRGKLTAESQKALKILDEKAGDALNPKVDVCDRECFGFPKGTRIINVFATPMHSLSIVKVGADYRILTARHASPD